MFALRFSALFAIASVSLLPAKASESYTLSRSYQGADFFNSDWTWHTFDDPTHGRVNYVDKDTAMAKNYSYAMANKFYMRANHVDSVPPVSRGRDSIRISSKFGFNDAILVLDLSHMPEGCATWPAWWTLSKQGPWPQGGEIDIVEGVNLENRNLGSLHTTPGCTMPPLRAQTGKDVSANCDATVNYNQGCGARFDSPNSYGSDFNNNNGGYFVLQRSRKTGIKMWFWARNSPNTPSEISNWDGHDISPNWPTPEANFPTDSCDYDSHFNEHSTVFDLTFCGDWAGTAYATSGCPGTCDDFVNNNPASFEKAYWEINSFRVYEPSSGGVGWIP